MAGLAAIGAVVGMVGTAVSAMGTIAQGKAAESAADFQAKQLKMKAKEEVAASQREAIERQRQGKLVQSQFQAGAAGSGLGAGALDPTIAELSGDIAGRTEYGRGMSLYGGRERAAGLNTQAQAAKMEGAAARQGSIYGALGTLASGFSSFGQKYAGGGYMPTADPSYDPVTPLTGGYNYG